MESVQNLNPALTLAEHKASRGKGGVRGVTSSLASSLRQASGGKTGGTGAAGAGAGAGGGGRGWASGSFLPGSEGAGVASVDVVLQSDLESDDGEESFLPDSDSTEGSGADGFADGGSGGGTGGGGGQLGAWQADGGRVLSAAAGVALGGVGEGLGFPPRANPPNPMGAPSSSAPGGQVGARGGAGGRGGAAAAGGGAGSYVVVATNLGTLLQRSTKPNPVAGSRPVLIHVQEALKLGLGHKDGIIKLEVRCNLKEQVFVLQRSLGRAVLLRPGAGHKDGIIKLESMGRNPLTTTTGPLLRLSC